MNRFQKKRGFSLSQLTLPASILIFLLIFLLFYKGVGSVSQTASEQQMENLQQAIRRSTVHCYAVEGSYPESLDESGAISPGELDGLPALILSQEIEGTSYRTYLYFEDGALKELLTEASREVTPEQGTAIVSLAGFSIEKTEDGFYSVRAEDANGEVLSAYIRPRTEVANSNA